MTTPEERASEVLEEILQLLKEILYELRNPKQP